MSTKENQTHLILDETEAAGYIGMPLAFLENSKDNGRSNVGADGPAFIHLSESPGRWYRTEDLETWLLDNPNATKNAMTRCLRARSRRKKPLARIKPFDKLIVGLETWLHENRPGLLCELNGPVANEELEHLEQLTGQRLPESYRQLLDWRNGQDDDSIATFNPFSHEQFMSASATEYCMEKLNRRMKATSYDDPWLWRKEWLPFMVDVYGNFTCIALGPASPGDIFTWYHDGSQSPIFDNLAEWLSDFLDKLRFLDVKVWEREGWCDSYARISRDSEAKTANEIVGYLDEIPYLVEKEVGDCEAFPEEEVEVEEDGEGEGEVYKASYNPRHDPLYDARDDPSFDLYLDPFWDARYDDGNDDYYDDGYDDDDEDDLDVDVDENEDDDQFPSWWSEG